MNKSKTIASALLLGALGVSAVQAAEPVLGPYIGVSGTQSRFDTDRFDIDDIDDEDTGWKGIAGYRFAPFFAAETAYVDFGETDAPEDVIGGPFRANAKALTAFGLGIVPLGPVELFGKLGASRVKSRGRIGGSDFSDADTKLAYGAGVQLALRNVGLRAEWEKFDTQTLGNLKVVSVGLTYTFPIAPR
jgi:opacity protein-like surface antigen